MKRELEEIQKEVRQIEEENRLARELILKVEEEHERLIEDRKKELEQ
jgi:hypothetical protein